MTTMYCVRIRRFGVQVRRPGLAPDLIGGSGAHGIEGSENTVSQIRSA